MRTFVLERDSDISGVSGIGTVAEGIQFTDGTVVVRWLSVQRTQISPTTVVHTNIDNVIALHGHGGATRIVWLGESFG